ncbi:MAG: DUF4440 domain-containing protein [Pseudomonadota bacterium]
MKGSIPVLGDQGLSDSDVDAIKQAVETWSNDLVVGDIDTWQTYWDANGMLMPPDQPRVVGRDNITAFITANFGGLKSLTLTDWVVAGRDDLAVAVTTVSWVTADGEASDPAKQVIVLRRHDGGRWLVQTVMFNSDGKS